MFKFVIFVAIAVVIFTFARDIIKRYFSQNESLGLPQGDSVNSNASAGSNVIPVFFASDDNYIPYASVAIKSLLDNSSKDYFYKIYILTAKLNEENIQLVNSMISETSHANASIEIVDVKNELDKISDMLSMRDYYSNATYYRFFISRLFPQYDKVLYLDCDICVKGDISKLYNEDISNYMVAASVDEIIGQTPLFVEYVENVLNIKTENYFNAGILLINTKAFRDLKVEQKFVSLLNLYRFVVDQDQGYLNVLCKDRVKYVDLSWNKGAYVSEGISEEDINIIHYKMQWRPWHYYGIDYESYFWKYAAQTPFFNVIKQELDTYTDEQRARDAAGGKRLLDLCYDEVHNPNNFMTLMNNYRKQEFMDSLSDVFNETAIINLFNFIK